MNKNEAIEYLQSRYLVVGSRVNPPKEECEKHNEVVDMAIKALEEVQQYRAIGTPEECRAAVEKQTAKKIVRRKAKDEDVESELRDFITRKGMIYRCPTCECCIAVDEMKSCFECGQLLDWSNEE